MKTHIVIHHSLTEDSRTMSWNAIRKYHKNANGWRDIGYHFGIERIDRSYEILMGRMLTDTGAHCKEMGMNRVGIGVCFVGNYDYLEPSIDMVYEGAKLCACMCELFNIKVENIIGHSSLATYKSCPGKMFPLELLRKLTTKRLLKAVTNGKSATRLRIVRVTEKRSGDQRKEGFQNLRRTEGDAP